MRKFIYLFLSLSTFVALCAACSDDKNDERTFDQSAEYAAQGVYTGTFSREQEGAAVPEVNYSEGTLTITPAGTNSATIKYECAEFSIDHQCVANICHSNDGFAFSNNLASNEIGSAFFGRIDDSSNIESHLKLRIRSGRNTKTYIIQFTGHKTSGAK